MASIFLIAVLLFTLHSVAAIDYQYIVLAKKSLSPNSSDYYVMQDTSSLVNCLVQTSSTSALLNSASFATHYDQASGSCAMVAGTGLVQLVDDSAKTTYVSSALLAINDNFRLSQTITSYNVTVYEQSKDNFTSAFLIPVGNLTYTGGLLPYGKTLWFPKATYNYPAIPNAYAFNLNSQLAVLEDLLVGDFAITMAVKLGTPMVSDMPLMELLGPSNGQLCFTLRSGCIGACIEVFHNPYCNCSIVGKFNLLSLNLSSWVHIAVSYNKSVPQLSLYSNGVKASVQAATLLLPSQKTTRLKVGASECHTLGAQYNTLFGTVACLKLYKRALSDVEVAEAYNLCH